MRRALCLRGRCLRCPCRADAGDTNEAPDSSRRSPLLKLLQNLCLLKLCSARALCAPSANSTLVSHVVSACTQYAVLQQPSQSELAASHGILPTAGRTLQSEKTAAVVSTS